MLLFTTDRTVVAKEPAKAMKGSEVGSAIDAAGSSLPIPIGSAVDIVMSMRARATYLNNFFENLFTQKQLSDELGSSTTKQVIDMLLSTNKKNYTIPHSEIIQLRVKLPHTWHVGRVTFTTAKGESKFEIALSPTSSKRGKARFFNICPADWSFLKSPPPKLVGKLVVDGPI
jgi:hypothetical protein